MSFGRSIRIYLADGTPSGIRHVEIVNWSGQAIIDQQNNKNTIAGIPLTFSLKNLNALETKFFDIFLEENIKELSFQST